MRYSENIPVQRQTEPVHHDARQLNSTRRRRTYTCLIALGPARKIKFAVSARGHVCHIRWTHRKRYIKGRQCGTSIRSGAVYRVTTSTIGKRGALLCDSPHAETLHDDPQEFIVGPARGRQHGLQLTSQKFSPVDVIGKKTTACASVEVSLHVQVLSSRNSKSFLDRSAEFLSDWCPSMFATRLYL